VTTSVVSMGAESTSGPDLIVSFASKPTVISSDQPFPVFAVRRYAMLAARQASVEEMENGAFFAELSVIEGVWGEGVTRAEALRDFEEAVCEWAMIKIDQRHGDIPRLGSVDLNVI